MSARPRRLNPPGPVPGQAVEQVWVSSPELDSDPYDPDEEDPAKSRALESSLWELQVRHLGPGLPPGAAAGLLLPAPTRAVGGGAARGAADPHTPSRPCSGTTTPRCPRPPASSTRRCRCPRSASRPSWSSRPSRCGAGPGCGGRGRGRGTGGSQCQSVRPSIHPSVLTDVRTGPEEEGA